MSSTPDIQRVSGKDLLRYIDDVARLRISVFREYPYLYDGDMEYERRYLQTYADCSQAVVVVALNGAEVVGASTGIPMRYEETSFRSPLQEAGYDPDRFFYCAESVLAPAWRGRGLGVRFFQEREAYATELGGFDYACFCSVVRPADHPLRPGHYQPLDRFWGKRGYHRLPSVLAHYAWKDVDSQEQTTKTLEFWVKSFGT